MKIKLSKVFELSTFILIVKPADLETVTPVLELVNPLKVGLKRFGTYILSEKLAIPVPPEEPNVEVLPKTPLTRELDILIILNKPFEIL